MTFDHFLMVTIHVAIHEDNYLYQLRAKLLLKYKNEYKLRAKLSTNLPHKYGGHDHIPHLLTPR